MSERQKYRNLLGSVGVGEPTVLTADNIAIVLCTYFEDLPECPKDDEDSETGWSKWAMQETDKVLDIALDEIIMPLVDRIEVLEAQLANDVTGREWVQLLKRSKELEATIERVRNEVSATNTLTGREVQQCVLRALDQK